MKQGHIKGVRGASEHHPLLWLSFQPQRCLTETNALAELPVKFQEISSKFFTQGIAKRKQMATRDMDSDLPYAWPSIKALNISTHQQLAVTPGGRNYHAHFRDEETEAQKTAHAAGWWRFSTSPTFFTVSLFRIFCNLLQTGSRLKQDSGT